MIFKNWLDTRPKMLNAWTKCLINHFGGCFARFLESVLRLGRWKCHFLSLENGHFCKVTFWHFGTPYLTYYKNYKITKYLCIESQTCVDKIWNTETFSFFKQLVILRSKGADEDDFFFFGIFGNIIIEVKRCGWGWHLLFCQTSQHWLCSIDLTIAHFPLCHQLLMNKTFLFHIFSTGVCFHHELSMKTNFVTDFSWPKFLFQQCI